MHPVYTALIAKAEAAHQRNRNPAEITPDDVARARLYCYAFRGHVIGAFHATRAALEELPPADSVTQAYRTRAIEALRDLVDLAMEDVPHDFRVVLSTLARYHRGIGRVVDSSGRAGTPPADAAIVRRFAGVMSEITDHCGLHLARDTHAPEQASFRVPNLGITIVPLIYGDHHSWNLAWLGGPVRHVPTHRHEWGVEIHLGYNPTHGQTVLAGHRADMTEGYAMPIPPRTDHGWVNTSDEPHHVPFVFGSPHHAGWGVFLDVEADPTPVESLRRVSRDSPPFGNMVYLEREIDRAAKLFQSWRRVLIPFTATLRTVPSASGSTARPAPAGGLELAITRATPSGFEYPRGDFRIVSIVRGHGRATIAGAERHVTPHDHFGIPAGLTGTLVQTGPEPLIALDATLRSHGTSRP
jgi:mannose-6-phosphate isomerase-like protein (cupin superfamily)